MNRLLSAIAAIGFMACYSCVSEEQEISTTVSSDNTKILAIQGNATWQYELGHSQISLDKKLLVHRMSDHRQGLHIVMLEVGKASGKPWALIEFPATETSCSGLISEVAWSTDSKYAAVRFQTSPECATLHTGIQEDDTLIVDVSSKSTKNLSRIVREALDIGYPFGDEAYHESMKISPITSYRLRWVNYNEPTLSFAWAYTYTINSRPSYPGLYEPRTRLISVVFNKPAGTANTHK